MVKQGYKQTEVGVIPEDWDCVTLLSKCNLLNGLTYSPNDIANNGLLVLRSSNVQDNQLCFLDNVYVNLTVDIEKLIQKDDIVVCVRNGSSALIGKCAKASKDYNATFGAFMAVLRGKNNDFIFQLLQQGTIQKHISRNSGATINQITNGDFKCILVPFPSDTSEAKRIADALSDVDGMISSLEKLIAKKKAVKQGAMQELLTGKKRLPGFSGEWYETTVGEHCCVFDGTHQTPKYTIMGIPFYSVENITASDFVNTKFITAEEHEQLSSKCKIEKGDILMTRIGSIGDCKYIDWDVNASFYVSLALIKCKETINAQFLSFYSTSSYFKKEIEIRSLLTAIPQKINLGPISEIKLNIPSDIKEQEAIASVLSDMDNEIEVLEQKLDKTRQIKQGMMQQLLTGKIRLI